MSALRELGFLVLRVRHHGEVARIELAKAEMPRLLEPGMMSRIDEALRAQGFKYVAVDLRGYRLGSLNEGLTLKPI